MPIALREINIQLPRVETNQPLVPHEIFEIRAKAAYDSAKVDWLIVYADREHIGNMVFLTGFEPRFEEALLLLGSNGRRVLLTGNESESYAPLARLLGLTVLRSQTLSLMGQDRTAYPKISDRLKDAGLNPGDTVGLVGWKYLDASEGDDPDLAHFVPDVYVRAIQRVIGKQGHIRNSTSVLMHAETGLRAKIDVHQIAAYEWSAATCSEALWQIVTNTKEGDAEYDAVARMRYTGQPINVHTMFASAPPGEPVIGLRSPTGRRLLRGDGVTTALGYWGALSSRAGLLDTSNDAFLTKAKSYFEGLMVWYDTADIGVTGGELFAVVTGQLAKGGLNSALNPGHLTDHEEWSNSPIRPDSKEKICSGMPFQVDVIPTPMPAGQALNCEDPVIFADNALRADLAKTYPEVFSRIRARRNFMIDELGITVKDSILPLSSTPLCLPPFWLRPKLLLVND